MAAFEEDGTLSDGPRDDLRKKLATEERVNDAITNVPVYAQAVRGTKDGDYEERTEWMEGWNACARWIVETNVKVRKRN